MAQASPEMISVSDWVALFTEVNNMAQLKKWLLIALSVVVFVLAITMVKNVYAGKPIISLNSPVSFPVDI
ncbi:hypothetical protein GCM10025856_13490 [Methylophaga marina]|jgi:hypothetical protein|uniref:Polysaccharide chain length determinant N-terminal domain-containing protein n=1 Tax=Methylophaga marina TaxID=45495 RepID=A0ABP3DGQ5_9GAMM|nr:hypothetical protein GCM10025856_13490 [Methylophaga marina]